MCDIVLLLSPKVPGVEGDTPHGLAALLLGTQLPLQVLAVLPDAHVHTHGGESVYITVNQLETNIQHHFFLSGSPL